jgi:peptide/nickel transport system permease protein
MSETSAIATPLAPVSGVLRTSRNRNSAWRRIARDRLSVSGLTILVLVAGAAIFAPLIAPYDPKTQDVRAIFADPSRAHLLGTDDLGRDILSRIIWGARASLSVGLVSVTIAVVCGVTLGLIAGFLGSWIDSVISRVLDIVF